MRAFLENDGTIWLEMVLKGQFCLKQVLGLAGILYELKVNHQIPQKV